MPLSPLPRTSTAADLPRPSSDQADPDGQGGRPAGDPLRLLVVDDHEIVRSGLVALLERRRQFQVVAQAATSEEALSLARRFVPDIVLMDLHLADGSGIESWREIRAELPQVRVVFLTASDDEQDVLAAILGGASGYVLKQTRAAALVSVLTAVGRGESSFDPAVTGKVLDRVRRIASGVDPDAAPNLTRQEQQILLLMAEGQTNREIATVVFLSDKTVKNYASSIFRKLKLERRSQTAAYVARHSGITGPGTG
jgi:two-component system, NarL family, response regulator DevR